MDINSGIGKQLWKSYETCLNKMFKVVSESGAF